MRKTRPGRVPPRSRGGGVHATGKMPPVAACRFATANPAPRCSVHPPGAHLDETIRRFTRVHPSGLPLAYAPRWITGRFSFFPELRTPPLPVTHVRAGTLHRTLTRATSSTSPPTSTSTRHLHMRPRVAPPQRCPSELSGSGPSQVPISQPVRAFSRHATLSPSPSPMLIGGSRLSGVDASTVTARS